MFAKLVIKIITIMGAVCLLHVNMHGEDNILEKKIFVTFVREDISTVIKELDKQLGGVFSYKENILPKNKKVLIIEQNKTVNEILNKIFVGTKVGFTEYKGKIILNTKSELKKITLSGTITDKSTGEVLIGANLYIMKSAIGASSNQYGFYSITMDEGIYDIIISFIGYDSQILSKIELNNSRKLNIELEPTSINLSEVVVEDKKYDRNVKDVEMGVEEFTPMSIESIPMLFGEQDILKTIQLRPGVNSAGEGGSGFSVRGGGIDQNQILLDEANVYNPSHLLGFFSTFNSDAINNVKLIKGNFPSEYGGRLASVMDVKMNEGNKKKYAAYGGIGLVASRLTLEGPIQKDKSSFIISGRRTYADLFIPLFSDASDATLYFYDLNAKANVVLGENDRIYLSGYFGRDVFSVSDLFGFDWGNATTTIRWNHIFGDKLFMNLTGIYSKYDYDIEIDDKEDALKINSGIEDVNFKSDFQYYLNDNNTIKFGGQVIKHRFTPGEISVTGQSNFNPIKIQETNAYESALYGGHEFKLSNKLSINYGLRFSNYSIVGPGNIYHFENERGEARVEKIEDGIIKSYNGIEPRISAVYLIGKTNSFKAAYSRNKQYIHLLSNSTSGTPIDLWQSSTNNVKPGIADQFSIGYFHNFNNNMYELSVESYFKDLQNQIAFKSGAQLTLNEFVEGELVFGKGRAYGVEFMFEKKLGDFTGWIAYTLSKTDREFPDIDDGKRFPAKLDRTHDLSIVGMYRFNNTWNFSLNWIYYTGNAVTFPNGKYMFDGNIVNYYTQRNGYRMPDYHRLDFGVTYNFGSSSSLNLSIYNVYGRKNAYSITFREKENTQNQTEAVRYALFSVFPSLTYNFRF